MKNRLKIEFKDKKINDIKENQQLLLDELNIIKSKSGLKETDFILDGHLCLLNKSNKNEKIPLNILKRFGIDNIIVIVDSVRNIKYILKELDNIDWSNEFIELFQNKEIKYARELAKEIGADLRIIKNHMDILWHEYTDKGGEEIPVTQASLTEKASIVGRVGIMLLSCGTGAWRVRSSMNALAEEMGITCTADIGLMSIEYTCFDGDDGFTQSLCLTNTGVNTSKLNRLEHFIREFEQGGQDMSGEQLHKLLDQIEEIHGLYSPIALGMAAALACGGFTFLLGGGPIEMLCAFVGAGIGNFIRCKLSKHHFTLFLCIASSVSAACLVYAGLLKAAELLWAISIQHEAGYICAMLFIIPGFPFITSGIDLAKLDMRSGMERLMYALIIVLVATMSAWIMALILGLQPVDFLKLDLTQAEWIVFRLLASFCGVFGFSIMFNSPTRLAAVAAGIGAIANTLRLELVDLTALPPAAAAFVGALTAGLLATMIKNQVGYPRISVTVPSIVIMVPGLYLYRGFYNLGTMNLSTSASWFAAAILIVAALPLGLIFARILTDKTFRYCT